MDTHSYKPGGRADKHHFIKEVNAEQELYFECNMLERTNKQGQHVSVFQVPEYVRVRQSVHELDLPEHVGSVTGQDVHLQSHDLARHTMLHLDHTEKNKKLLYFDPLTKNSC